jgi:hypothetical protein
MTTTIETPSTILFNGVCLSDAPYTSICNVLGEPMDEYENPSWEIVKDGQVVGCLQQIEEGRNDYYFYGVSKVLDLQLLTSIVKSVNIDLGKPSYSFSVELSGRYTILKCE